MRPLRLNNCLDCGLDGIERAMNGELSAEHLEYLDKTGLRSTIVAVVARPRYAALVTTSPFVNPLSTS